MMCQEVIELMQRYLDQDLDEIEYNQMLNHLQDCAECTVLFQQLLSVSEHLENLPEVTPSFSLVDAILPRLQHIDAAPTATDYGITKVAAISATKASGQPEPARAQKKDAVTVTRLTGWRSRTRGFISARIIGGVVAAGLVLGFFVFDRQEQSNMQNADSALMAPTSASQSRSANKEQFNPADTFSAAGSNDLKDPATAPLSTGKTPTAPIPEESKVAPSLKEVVPPSNAPFTAPKAKADSAPAQYMGSNKIGGSIPEGGTSPSNKADDSLIPSVAGQTNNNSQQVASSVPSTGTGQLREPATFGTKQTAAAKADITSNATPVAPTDAPSSYLTAPATNPATPSVSSTASGGSAAGSSLGEPAKEGIMTPASPTESSTDINKLKVGSGALVDPSSPSMKFADSNSLVSLDKQYTASVIENRVIIKDKNGKTLFTSARVRTDSDKVTLIEWTPDSKLTYQVNNQAGTRSYVITASNWTEVNK